MHILTTRLIKLSSPWLPLPWYHRAPLGLISGVPVHVALQAPRERPFGDLLVSVVDPANWRGVSEISFWTADAPGVLADVYQLAPPLNIVFAEAVTIDSGSRHDTCLVVEPFGLPAPDIEATSHDIDRITSSLSARSSDIRSHPLHPDVGDLAWMNVGNISIGWAEVDGWRDAVAKQAAAASNADEYDDTIAVVSADTIRRVLRFVFPRKGAVTVSVSHTDRPGAMATIATALAGSRLNVLSSLLRRGSAGPQKAEVVMVLEPIDSGIDSAEVDSRVKAALATLNPTLRISVSVSTAVDPEDAVLFPRRPHEIAIRPARTLEAAILAVRADLPPGKRPIFLSRRFVDPSDAYNHGVVSELKNVLDEHDFVAVEALPQPGAEILAPDEVKAKMWASEAAIVLVLSTPDEREFSENLAHELGFMQGQGKPLLPLVQEDVSNRITRNANMQGLQLTTFNRENATDRQRSDSIHETVHAWLELLSHR